MIHYNNKPIPPIIIIAPTNPRNNNVLIIDLITFIYHPPYTLFIKENVIFAKNQKDSYEPFGLELTSSYFYL